MNMAAGRRMTVNEKRFAIIEAIKNFPTREKV